MPVSTGPLRQGHRSALHSPARSLIATSGAGTAIFIELTHKDGISSRYAHMHEYGDGIQMGSVVQAGDLIGYVGTTGLSTGPHLHFEIRQRGEPTDPLAFEMETGADASQSVAGSDLEEYRVVIADILSVQ
ncbi:M23 family metallopeptidase [Roseibium salinum]|nr:M23 family metallopeptidase [Roseibium salinum]